MQRHVELAQYYAKRHNMERQAVHDLGYVIDFSVLGQHKFTKETYQAALKACGLKHRRPMWNYWERLTGEGKYVTLLGKLFFADGNWANSVAMVDFADNKDKWFLGQFRFYRILLTGAICATSMFGIYLAIQVIVAADGLVNYNVTETLETIGLNDV